VLAWDKISVANHRNFFIITDNKLISTCQNDEIISTCRNAEINIDMSKLFRHFGISTCFNFDISAIAFSFSTGNITQLDNESNPYTRNLYRLLLVNSRSCDYR
jgi:hypothetical protein